MCLQNLRYVLAFVIVALLCTWLVNVVLPCLEHFETLASTLRWVVEGITTRWLAPVHNWSMQSNRGLTNLSLNSRPSGNVTANDGSFETALSSIVYICSLVNETAFFCLCVTDETVKGIYNHPLPSALFTSLLLPYFVTRIWSYCNGITSRVRKKFENPDAHALIREGIHFERTEVDEVRRAFLNQTDTLGLVGVVFGPAGTGKSNVVRTVCRREVAGGEPKGVEGVIYMEIGSPSQFPYHLAKACGVPVEPSWFDVAISKLFPAWKTHLTLPSNDKDALALVLPVIAEGGREYKNNHKHKHIPVLFIDGVDILAKQDEILYQNLVDWAKKCANEDSLRIVFVCSDSHVLVLDQQSFKSRLDTLIEIGDVDENQAIKKLMVEKYGVEEDLAREIYKIVGGRLSDIHKFISKWRGTKQVDVSDEVVNATKGIKKYLTTICETMLRYKSTKTTVLDQQDKTLEQEDLARRQEKEEKKKP